MNREEAIKILNARPYTGEVREALETLIPELKESENEKMRKELVNFLLSPFIKENLTDEKVKPWLAYLEKQKEPLPIPDKFSGLKSLMLQYLQSAANRKDDSEIESDTDLWGRKILDYVWKYSDEQKEQKPAEWSEKDEKIIETICEEGNLKPSERHWLKSLRPSWKPSEEELVTLKRAGNILRPYGYSELAKKVFMIEGKLANLSVINKSAWKPSEEQMKALNEIINTLAASKYPHENDYLFNMLNGLRRDLKKL